MFRMLVAFVLAVQFAAGKPSHRIVNGVDSDVSKHPHQVSLEYSASGSSGWRHICGASIIGDKWAVTAAHCVQYNASNAAFYQIGLNDGRLDGQIAAIPLVRIVPHPEYNVGSGAYPNDIALIELTQSVSSVSGIHAATEMAASGQNFNGQTCTISGWGLTVGGGSSLPNQLQETTGTIIDTFTCSLSYLIVNINGNVHICIDNANSGACNGDSGGPMICNGVLAGVTSFGASGCSTSSPSVYARVSNYRTWINSVAGL